MKIKVSRPSPRLSALPSKEPIDLAPRRKIVASPLDLYLDLFKGNSEPIWMRMWSRMKHNYGHLIEEDSVSEGSAGDIVSDIGRSSIVSDIGSNNGTESDIGSGSAVESGDISKVVKKELEHTKLELLESEDGDRLEDISDIIDPGVCLPCFKAIYVAIVANTLHLNVTHGN